MIKMEWTSSKLGRKTVTVTAVHHEIQMADLVPWENLLMLEHFIIPKIINYNRLRQQLLPHAKLLHSITFTRTQCNHNSYP